MRSAPRSMRHGRYVSLPDQAEVAVPKESVPGEDAEADRRTATKTGSTRFRTGRSDASHHDEREMCLEMTRKSTKSASRE